MVPLLGKLVFWGPEHDATFVFGMLSIHQTCEMLCACPQAHDAHFMQDASTTQRLLTTLHVPGGAISLLLTHWQTPGPAGLAGKLS